LKPNILVIDDNELRNFLGESLREFGYHVDIADGVPNAMPLMKTRNYHVIITDKNMPGMNGSKDGGFDIAGYSKEYLPNTKVIIITGDRMAEIDRRILDLGIADIVFKPFQMSTLKEKIDKLIRY